MKLERLKLLRAEKSLTQQQLCELFSVSQPTYSQYENGNVDPPLALIINLSIFYDVSTDYLLGKTGKRK